MCFCLGITAIDPVRMDLLFERFLSLERAEPPDIDLDIEHERREEVIQWVYRRYGRERAAMVGSVIRYRTRSAIRDVGKALGIAPAALETVAKLVGHYDGTVSPDILAQAGLAPDVPLHRQFLTLVHDIANVPRHLSIHPGGFLLGRDPLETLVPVEPGAMDARTVIQWDKYDIDALRLFKVDLLGLGALTLVRKTFELMRTHENVDLDMVNVPAEDPMTYALLCRADTVGVFQVESRAQMAMLPRMLPRTFYDLVIEVAIVRPGPIQGDMVHPYLRRRSGQETIVFPHKNLKRVLGKTLGVPIFQEQVMKLAMLVADYSAGEADQLRRDMAAWRSAGKIDQHHTRMVGRMIQNGIESAFAERVFSQIQGFGEYGFPESHAASFALIAYVTAWLRCHHLPAFTCALLNAQPLGFYSPATIVQDAKRHDVEVLPIDVLASAWDCTLTPRANGQPYAFAVRMGFRYVKGLHASDRARIESVLAHGPFVSPEDFIQRTRLGRPALLALAEAGAFSSLHANRRETIWAISGLLTQQDLTLPSVQAQQQEANLPNLSASQTILWDLQSSLHSTRGHPLETVRAHLAREGLPTAHDVGQRQSGQRVSYVGVVICRQRPMTANGVTFFTLEDESGFVNVVVWRPIYERYRLLAKTAAVLGVTGRIEAHDGVTHLIADALWQPKLAAQSAVRSRDFH